MKKLITIILTMVIFSVTIQAQEQSQKLSITLGTPWVGVKYDIIPKISAEFRDIIDPDLNIPTLRGYYNFYRNEKLTGFAGLEYRVISFKSDNTSGDGSLATLFTGAEYKILPKLSISADIGYSAINLKSSDISVSGPEYIFNLGVNYNIK